MTILVCPLSHVARIVASRAPERIVSLLDPDMAFPETGHAYVERHLRLQVHDIPTPAIGLVAPTAGHMNELLVFLAAWTRRAPILIHCYAGYSRSSAAAYITACLHNPHADEFEIAHVLRAASPRARPNCGLVQLADAALGRNGRMAAAIAELCRNWPGTDCEENDPFEMPGVFGDNPAAAPSRQHRGDSAAGIRGRNRP